MLFIYRFLISTGILFLSFCSHANAGWYVVNNYKGKIGSRAIHLSLQKYGSFGNDQELNGSYYYDKRHTPIPLYGKLTGSKIELCEVRPAAEYDKYIFTGSKDGSDTSDCPFKLADAGSKLEGTWQNKTHQYDVQATLTSSLDNTDPQEQKIKGVVEIPFWGQTKTHSFMGIYQSVGENLTIRRINVVNKKSGKIDQVINPQLHDCEFGFFMTWIYMNLESGSNTSGIRLNCYSLRPRYAVKYQFDTASHRYRTRWR